MLARIGICLLFLVSIDFRVSAQFFDDFSDPNISSRYSGNVQDFRVTAGEELQLNAVTSGTAYLTRPVAFPDSFVWEIYFRLEFDPSSSNRARIWISSDQEVLENGNGLYIEIGESLNTDAIRLFRKTGNSRIELAAGAPGRVALNPAKARVRCTYNAMGVLSMWSDYSGNNDFSLEFEVTVPQDIFEGVRYTGFHCIFTESRRTSYFFDDFLADVITNDTQAPRIVGLTPVNSKLLVVQFSESIDTSMLTSISTSLFPSVGALRVMTWQGNSRYCGIELENALTNGQEYRCQISGVKDLAGNIMGDTAVQFNFLIYEVPDPYDVLFTELMVKPSPAQGLPGEEYIEVYNRSDKYLQLADFNILDGSTFRKIDSCVLLPGEFAALVSRSHRLLFENFGKVATMASFPALTDAGKRLVLYYQNSLLVDWITYNDTWYRSTAKGSGGFSLELINPQAPCALSRNWIASNNPSGGTPCKINSVWQEEPDTLRPVLEYVYMSASGVELEMVWDKKLDPFTANRLASYNLEELMVSQVLWDPLAPSQAILRFEDIASADKVYTIIASRVADCEGLTAGEKAIKEFTRPVLSQQGQLLVNEILFYAETGGSRYIELINVGPYYVDLSTLFVADFSTNTAGKAIDHKRLLKPGGIVALGANPSFLSSRYQVPDTAWILPFAVPTLSDREGNVSVYTFNNTERILLDSVNYSRSMHYPLLSDRRGVSLERLSADGPSNDRSNWYSSAENVGYGTPGYANSQTRMHELADVTARVTLLTPYFSPNQDGYLDRMELYYDLEKPGFSARAEVYDLQGNRIKTLANQELLGASGYITWDGSNENGRPALMGIYAIIAEMVHPDGEIIRFKKSCTLVGQID
jgi:hypothetical protein